MKKNTLIVFVVILVPIIIMGSLAVMGAENYEDYKKTHGGEHEGENTEAMETMVTPEIILPLNLQYAGLAIAPTA